MADYFNDDEEQLEFLRQYNSKRKYKRTYRRLALGYFRLAWKCFKMSMKG